MSVIFSNPCKISCKAVLPLNTQLSLALSLSLSLALSLEENQISCALTWLICHLDKDMLLSLRETICLHGFRLSPGGKMLNYRCTAQFAHMRQTWIRHWCFQNKHEHNYRRKHQCINSYLLFLTL